MAKNPDRIDCRILDLLQRNGRITTVELAERANLSATPVARRWRRLEDEGYIRGYTALIDRKKVGYGVMAYVFVRLRSNDWRTAEAFEQAIPALTNVMECCVVTGASDYLLRVVARDLDDYESFLKRGLAVIETIDSVDSTIVLKQIVDRSNLPF